MANPVVTAVQVGQVSSGSSVVFSSRTVTAGNALVVLASQPSSAVRTYSTSDDNSNTWNGGAQQATNGNAIAYCDYALNANSGGTVVTVGAGASVTFYATLYEVSGSTLVEDVAPVGNADNTASDNAYPGFNPAVNIAAESATFVAGVHGATAGNLTPDSGTNDYSSTTVIHYHEVRTSSASSQSQGWSGDGTLRWSAASGFSLKNTGGGGTTPKGVFGKALYGPLRRVVM